MEAMKNNRTIPDSINDLLKIADEFVEMLAINKVKSWFTISDRTKDSPVFSETEIRFYQPSDNSRYNLMSEYSYIQIGGIELGTWGCVKYKLSHDVKSIDLITKEAKRVLDEFKIYSFASMAEKALLEKRNEVKRIKDELKKATKECDDLKIKIQSYK